MIDISEVCEKVLADCGYYAIFEIFDTGDAYIVVSCGKDGELPDVSPCLVDKQTGNLSIYFYPDNPDLIENSKKVKVPDEYKFNK